MSVSLSIIPLQPHTHGHETGHAATIFYRLPFSHSIIHNMYCTQDIRNANCNSSRLLGILHNLKLLWYQTNTTGPSMLCQMLLMLGAVYSGRVAALAWATAGPNHTPSVTLLCHSVLVSWQSAHAGHQNH